MGRTSIIGRRIVAEILVIVSVPLLAGLLIVKSELRDLDVYEFSETDFYVGLADEVLEDPDAILPDALAGADTPSGPDAQASIIDLLLIALPVADVQEEAEAFLDGAIPNLTDNEDSSAIQPRLGGKLA